MATKTPGTMTYTIGYSTDERVEIKRVKPAEEIGSFARSWGEAIVEDRRLEDGTPYSLMKSKSAATYVAIVELDNTRDVERNVELIRLIRNGVFAEVLSSWGKIEKEA